MKKIFSTLVAITAVFGINAQCTGVDFIVSTDTVSCGGDSVHIIADGVGNISTALGSDFNLGTAGPGWTVSPAGVYTNPCGPGPGGATNSHMWMGNTTAAPREMVTAQLDVQCGGEVCFDFRMAIQGQASPCEGPDVTATEGIYIESSIDNGATWLTMNYFAPNTSGSFNSQSPGSGDYTGWARYCFPIPAAHETDTTVFHWYQGGSSGNGFDHWGIDSVVISSFDCTGYYYDWDHIAGSPDTNEIDIFTDTDTSFTVIYTDGLSDTCIGTVNIVHDTNIVLNVVTTTLTSCVGVDDGSAEVAGAGIPNYDYTITGPASGNNSTGIFNNLPAGTYTAEVIDSFGCYGITTFNITAGPTFNVNTSTTDEVCDGYDDGSLTSMGSGGVAPYDYTITGSGTGNNATGVFSPLTPGTYFIEVVDDIGCVSYDTVVINDGLILNAVYSDSGVTCFGDTDGWIDIVPSNGTGPYTYTITGPGGTVSNFNGDFTNLAAGTYYVVTEDGSGCFFSDSVVVFGPAEVIADFDAFPDIGLAPLNVDFTNNSSGATTYQWYFGDGDSSSLFDPSHVYGTGVYEAMLIASNGPCSDTAYHPISAIYESFITFPNIITPNSDGLNDVFEAIDYQGIVEFSCSIFNRWGTELYNFNDVTGSWDGKTKGGKPVADGTYYFIVTAKGIDAQDHVIKGTLNVHND